MEIKGRLERLHQIAALKRDHDLARLSNVGRALATARAADQELERSLAEQARLAGASGDVALHRAFLAHACHSEGVRSDLLRKIENLAGQRERLRAEAALSFGRAIALERLAARQKDDDRQKALARQGS